MLETLMKTFFILILACFTLTAQAECKRFKTQKTKPGYDGPGSFSSLHNTLTLDCLTLVNIGTINGTRVAVIKDETSKNYFIKLGDYMGENSGQVVEILEHTLVIEQQHQTAGQWVKKRVIFNNKTN